MERDQNAREMAESAQRKESGLAKIEVPDDNPFVLFKAWHAAALASDLVVPDVLCLSTATKEGRVSARHVRLRRLDDDGFVIMTDRRSRKAAEIAENSTASMVFLWCYRTAEGMTINHQVRIEGDMMEVMPENYGDVYDREPLFCKVRSVVCHQDQKVDWQELKNSHDKVVQDVADGRTVIECPEHIILYKLIPTMMEFYFAHDFYIGDRIMFLKKDHDKWEHSRIAA